MKILHIQKVKGLAGSEKYFLELIPELEKRGVQTHFVNVVYEQDRDTALIFEEKYKELGLSMSVAYFNSNKSILKVLKFIRKEIEKFNPDIVHSHLIHSDFWTAILKKRNKIKVPLLSTKHGYDEAYISVNGFDASKLKPNLYYRMARYAESKIDFSYAVSHGLKKLFVEGKIAREEKMDVIHHGFDLPDLDKTTVNPIRRSQNQIIVIGRIIPFKGHIHLINALPYILEKVPDFHLIILGAGDAELIQELKDQTNSQSTEKMVSFEGFKTNIYDYLKGSDVMVVPSIAEGFGLIFLEGLNAKLPIVGFDVPATNEIIQNDINGYLVSPFDEKKLAEKIIYLLQNKDVRSEMGEEGNKLLMREFSLTAMVNKTTLLYERLLASS